MSFRFITDTGNDILGLVCKKARKFVKILNLIEKLYKRLLFYNMYQC